MSVRGLVDDVPYGSIRFAGSKRAPSKWVSISKESSVEDVYDLLVDTWQLERPPVEAMMVAQRWQGSVSLVSFKAT